MKVVAFNSASRDGLPLPALTVEVAVSQLMWRALGPRPDLVKPMIGWVTGDPVVDGGSGEPWTPGKFRRCLSTVQAVGVRTPLEPGIAARLMAPDAVTETDIRMRRLFRLPTPGSLSATCRQVVTATDRVLSVIGPLPVPDLVAAVSRRHSRRRTPAPTVNDVVEALVLAGAHHDPRSDTWSAPANVDPWPRDVAFLAAADPDREYAREEMAALLVQAGYPAARAYKNALDTHPLIRPAGPGRYGVLSNHHCARGAQPVDDGQEELGHG